MPLQVTTMILGDTKRLTVQFSDPNSGSPVDPGTVTFGLKQPNTAAVHYVYPTAVVKISTGLYYYDFTPSVVGQWIYSWLGTVPYPGYIEQPIVVAPPQVV